MLVPALFCLVASSSWPKTLAPGSAAPPLSIRRWLKGEPIVRLEPKKTYVIDFWASWCGPCRRSIPHLTELAKRYPDVTFLGVGVLEDDGPMLAECMADLGDKMGYRVGYSGNEDGMEATWKKPAAQRGVPSAFVVKDRKIVWIGNPFNIDKPLEEIERGTFDLASFKREYAKEAEKERWNMAVEAEFQAAVRIGDSGKWKEAKRALADVLAKDPKYDEAVARVQYDWLADEDHEAWLEKTKAMVATGDVAKVASFAYHRAQKPAGADLARTAIGMVLRSDQKDAFLSDGLTVYRKLGDLRDELRVLDRMIEIFPKDPAPDYPVRKDLLLKRKAELEARLAGR